MKDKPITPTAPSPKPKKNGAFSPWSPDHPRPRNIREKFEDRQAAPPSRASRTGRPRPQVPPPPNKSLPVASMSLDFLSAPSRHLILDGFSSSPESPKKQKPSKK